MTLLMSYYYFYLMCIRMPLSQLITNCTRVSDYNIVRTVVVVAHVKA